VALEKRLEAALAQTFAVDGTATGLITILDASEFKVKQLVHLAANTLPNLDLEIKRVISATQLYVGPKGGSIDARTDISAYTVALGANIFANEQLRPSIPNESINRAVFEEEPTNAHRVFLVDELGNDYDTDNPFPVSATFSGTVNVGLGATTPTIANISVSLANTEYSYILPVGTKQFTVKDRAGDAKTRIAYIPGATTSTFKTVDMGCTYEIKEIASTTGLTVYFQSSKASRTIEIESWA
jgi:hypothetical protein